MNETQRPPRPFRSGPSATLAYGPFGPYFRPQTRYRGSRDDYELVHTTAYGRMAGLSGSADLALRYSLDAIRERSRTLAAENSICIAITDRVCDVILGASGLTLQARTANERWNQRAEALWAEERRRPESRNLLNDLQEQRQTLLALFTDGDLLKIRVEDLGQVQHVEADRLATWGVTAPAGLRIEQGVELDSLDRITGWHVRDYDAYGNPTTKPRRVDAADGIWSALTRRISQTRGVPIQYPNFAMFDRIADICDSEAAAWQILSRLAVAITSAYGAEGAEAVPTESDATVADVAQRVQEYSQALVFHLKAGETINGITHNVPGQNFTESLKTFFRLLGLPFGMTLEFTLLIWSDTTYSSGRASKLMIERNVRPHADRLADILAAEYRWRVARWVRSGQLPVRADAFDHAFICEPYPFLDPKAEAQATQIRFEVGTTSRSREAAAIGLDDEQLVTEQTNDLRRRIAAIRDLRAEFSDDPLAAELAAGVTLQHYGYAAAKAAGTTEPKTASDTPDEAPDDTPDDHGPDAPDDDSNADDQPEVQR